ncbi:methyltransferase [Pseudobacteriovorax antillogorgiicola]|uniref:Methyltransferase domain-containing protein n=1 Tax=Pseudobacteriovorax antillogorgiicola TaxID=1513793 RepID=A0A1Y6CVD4_9BACT|nr:methyltransferase [Pseudobacteriovorax antillogorgiicola]TCS43638.1 hypothetical protein EDD56_13531 [Pseudobacteriovorax antillogorgiicola]SMF79963.1 hypothetical protein SAMN06296036_13422 [Pseudobacteriovorax antillogorgiicola]
MHIAEQALLSLLLNSTENRFQVSKGAPNYLSSAEMAELYAKVAFLGAAIEFLQEKYWLKNRDDNISGIKKTNAEFIAPFFIDELLALSFLKSFFETVESKALKPLLKKILVIESALLECIKMRSDTDRKDFTTKSLQAMSLLFQDEERRQGSSDEPIGPRLYRAFDGLDLIFNLDYSCDKTMIVDKKNPERLYQGSGVGVQSGYSTILLALHFSNLPKNSCVVDLGSGYGRVGLAFSLLRPDIKFIGYEYVPHRVALANDTGRAFQLESNLTFIEQDLSLEDFKIPEADAYYLYDPFTKETYEHVLRQIIAVSKRRSITVVTKGNAREWLLDIAQAHSWPTPVYVDGGNLCIFRSQPKPL